MRILNEFYIYLSKSGPFSQMTRLLPFNSMFFQLKKRKAIDFSLNNHKYRIPPHKAPWGNKKSLVITPWGCIEKKGFWGHLELYYPMGL